MDEIKWYECVEMWLPEKKGNESLEEWSRRIEPYIDETEPSLSDGYIVRDVIMTTRKEKRSWLREQKHLIDAVMNSYHNKGIRIMHRNWANNDKLVPVPNRKENESIEEWSDRIETFIYFLHKLDSLVTYFGSQPLDMTYDDNEK